MEYKKVSWKTVDDLEEAIRRELSSKHTELYRELGIELNEMHIPFYHQTGRDRPRILEYHLGELVYCMLRRGKSADEIKERIFRLYAVNEILLRLSNDLMRRE